MSRLRPVFGINLTELDTLGDETVEGFVLQLNELWAETQSEPERSRTITLMQIALELGYDLRAAHENNPYWQAEHPDDDDYPLGFIAGRTHADPPAFPVGELARLHTTRPAPEGDTP